MSYNNYNGAYLEGIICNAKKSMNSIKKYKTFNLSLLDLNQISSMKEAIDTSCKKLKIVNFSRYKSAKHYSNNSVVSNLDHYLAIDDILYNDEKNLSIGIDWTTNPNSISDKVFKHNELKEVLDGVVDITCVVLIQYEDILDELDSSLLAKAIYNLLKVIDKAVAKKDYAGYVIVDAHALL